jgi:HAD superfamily hydrolase (TIGR01662 family)
MTEAVLFDVDFTLIYPGWTFQADGYTAYAARHGMILEPERFGPAVAAAAPLLDSPDCRYHHDLFVGYTRAIIEGMGGEGDQLEPCARLMYDEWALCHHFHLYDDVRPALERLARAGIRVGLVSNSHRCLDTFQSHFGLDGLVTASVSSSEHGYLKPHPSIFEEALARLGAVACNTVMVGDSLAHDIDGAMAVGMRGVLIRRDGAPLPAGTMPGGVPVICSLTDLAAYV